MRSQNKNENNAQFAEYSHLSRNVEPNNGQHEMTSIQSSGEYVSKYHSASPKDKINGGANVTINTAFSNTSNYNTGSPQKRNNNNPFNVAKQRANVIDNSSGSKGSNSKPRQNGIHNNHML